MYIVITVQRWLAMPAAAPPDDGRYRRVSIYINISCIVGNIILDKPLGQVSLLNAAKLRCQVNIIFLYFCLEPALSERTRPRSFSFARTSIANRTQALPGHTGGDNNIGKKRS